MKVRKVITFSQRGITKLNELEEWWKKATGKEEERMNDEDRWNRVTQYEKDVLK